MTADNETCVAKRSDWKTEPMPDQHESFVLERDFSDNQMAVLRRGNIPKAMEDKWFWYMEDSSLWAYRSWTGFCIYRIDFSDDGKHLVTVNRDPEQYRCTSIEEDIATLNKLLDWWSKTPYDHYGEWLSETSDAIKRLGILKDLSQYDNTTCRVYTKYGDVLTGACEWNSPDYNQHEYDVEEESLQIGDYVVFESDISEIELLRPEACYPVRDWPEAKEEIAAWFAQRWHRPLEDYQKSITECLGEETGVPQWYVVVRGSTIIAGCGVIENDSHERVDLAPNVCAIYVDDEYRGQGIGGFLLEYVCNDMAAMGYETLYLLTDHTDFYEKFGWEFLSMVRGNDGQYSRMYLHRTTVEKESQLP